MIPCPGCRRSEGARGLPSLPCGRDAPHGIADELLQLSECRQKLVDAVQAGLTDDAAVIGRVVFRIARSLHDSRVR